MKKIFIVGLMLSTVSAYAADTSAGPATGAPEIIEGIEFFSAPDRRPRAATQGLKLRTLTEVEMEALITKRGLPEETIHQASQQYIKNHKTAAAFADATNFQLEEAAQQYQRFLGSVKERRDRARTQVRALSAAQEAALVERAGDLETVRDALMGFVSAPRMGETLADLDRDALKHYALKHRSTSERARRQNNPSERRAALAKGRITINWPAGTSEEDQRDALRYYQWYPAPLAAPDTPELVHKYVVGYHKKVGDERDRRRRKADNMFAQRAQAARAQEKE